VDGRGSLPGWGIVTLSSSQFGTGADEEAGHSPSSSDEVGSLDRSSPKCLNGLMM
jgi:hypothetical protein